MSGKRGRTPPVPDQHRGAGGSPGHRAGTGGAAPGSERRRREEALLPAAEGAAEGPWRRGGAGRREPGGSAHGGERRPLPGGRGGEASERARLRPDAVSRGVPRYPPANARPPADSVAHAAPARRPSAATGRQDNNDRTYPRPGRDSSACGERGWGWGGQRDPRATRPPANRKLALHVTGGWVRTGRHDWPTRRPTPATGATGGRRFAGASPAPFLPGRGRPLLAGTRLAPPPPQGERPLPAPPHPTPAAGGAGAACDAVRRAQRKARASSRAPMPLPVAAGEPRHRTPCPKQPSHRPPAALVSSLPTFAFLLLASPLSRPR